MGQCPYRVVASADSLHSPGADRRRLGHRSGQIARYLTELGVVPYLHPWGSDALTRAVELRPDLIVLDIQLPDHSGWDVLAQLKHDPRTRAIPVLIISVEEDRARGIALGAHEYLVKPITRPQLYAALRKLIPSGISGIVRAPFSVVPTADR